MPYNPESVADRRALAQSILECVLNASFIEEKSHDIVRERVFYREVGGGIRVQVWTTIEGVGETGEVRQSGEDSIKICAVYRQKSGQDRGLLKQTRVHRTGEIQAVCERLLTRMRQVYVDAANTSRCGSCGAPLFTSKNKNLVCAELCWKK